MDIEEVCLKLEVEVFKFCEEVEKKWVVSFFFLFCDFFFKVCFFVDIVIVGFVINCINFFKSNGY